MRCPRPYGLGTDVLGQPANTASFPWAAVNGRRLTLSFSPASQADEDALESLLPEGEITDPSQLPGSIPAHLVEVIPELRLAGELVQSGAAMNLGHEMDFAFTVHQRGHGPDTEVSPVTAGSYLQIAVAGGSVSPARLETVQARAETTQAKLESGDAQQLASLTREDLLGDLFHAGTLAYFGQLDALATLQARQQGLQTNLAPSAGTYGYTPKVTYLFGLPQAIEPGGVTMDLDRIARTNGGLTSTDERVRFNTQIGALSSALEHGVPEQMFSTEDHQAEGISAVKALALANHEGQRIYRITQANQSAVIPQINLSSQVKDEIRAAIAAGNEVTTHTDPVAVPGYEGAGYVILNPETGAGAWKIGGGLNGGSMDLDDSRAQTASFVSLYLSDGASGKVLEVLKYLLIFVTNLAIAIANKLWLKVVDIVVTALQNWNKIAKNCEGILEVAFMVQWTLLFAALIFVSGLIAATGAVLFAAAFATVGTWILNYIVARQIKLCDSLNR